MRQDTALSAALIRQARLRAGLSQVQLGDRSMRGSVQVQRWETGVVAPSFENLLAVLRACDYELSLDLKPRDPVDDERLKALQRCSPERRLDLMLAYLDEKGRA